MVSDTIKARLPAEIKGMRSALSENTVKSQEIDELVRWLTEKEKALDVKESELIRKEKEQQQRLKDHDKNIGILRNEEVAIVQSQMELGTRESELDEREKKLDKIRDEIEAKITSYKNDIDALESREKEIRDYEESFEQDKKILDEKEESIIEKIKELESKQGRFDSIEAKIKSRQANLELNHHKLSKIHAMLKEKMKKISDLEQALKERKDLLEKEEKELRLRFDDAIQAKLKELEVQELALKQRQIATAEKEKAAEQAIILANEKLLHAKDEEHKSRQAAENIQRIKERLKLEEVRFSAEEKQKMKALETEKEELEKREKYYVQLEEQYEHKLHDLKEQTSEMDDDPKLHKAAESLNYSSKLKELEAKLSSIAPSQPEKIDESASAKTCEDLLLKSLAAVNSGNFAGANDTLGAAREMYVKIAENNPRKKSLNYNLRMIETQLKMARL